MADFTSFDGYTYHGQNCQRQVFDEIHLSHSHLFPRPELPHYFQYYQPYPGYDPHQHTYQNYNLYPQPHPPPLQQDYTPISPQIYFTQDTNNTNFHHDNQTTIPQHFYHTTHTLVPQLPLAPTTNWTYPQQPPPNHLLYEQTQPLMQQPLYADLLGLETMTVMDQEGTIDITLRSHHLVPVEPTHFLVGGEIQMKAQYCSTKVCVDAKESEATKKLKRDEGNLEISSKSANVISREDSCNSHVERKTINYSLREVSKSILPCVKYRFKKKRCKLKVRQKLGFALFVAIRGKEIECELDRPYKPAVRGMKYVVFGECYELLEKHDKQMDATIQKCYAKLGIDKEDDPGNIGPGQEYSAMSFGDQCEKYWAQLHLLQPGKQKEQRLQTGYELEVMDARATCFEEDEEVDIKGLVGLLNGYGNDTIMEQGRGENTEIHDLSGRINATEKMHGTEKRTKPCLLANSVYNEEIFLLDSASLLSLSDPIMNISVNVDCASFNVHTLGNKLLKRSHMLRVVSNPLLCCTKFYFKKKRCKIKSIEDLEWLNHVGWVYSTKGPTVEASRLFVELQKLCPHRNTPTLVASEVILQVPSPCVVYITKGRTRDMHHHKKTMLWLDNKNGLVRKETKKWKHNYRSVVQELEAKQIELFGSTDPHLDSVENLKMVGRKMIEQLGQTWQITYNSEKKIKTTKACIGYACKDFNGYENLHEVLVLGVEVLKLESTLMGSQLKALKTPTESSTFEMDEHINMISSVQNNNVQELKHNFRKTILEGKNVRTEKKSYIHVSRSLPLGPDCRHYCYRPFLTCASGPGPNSNRTIVDSLDGYVQVIDSKPKREFDPIFKDLGLTNNTQIKTKFVELYEDPTTESTTCLFLKVFQVNYYYRNLIGNGYKGLFILEVIDEYA